MVYKKFLLRMYKRSMRFPAEHRVFKERIQTALFDQIRLFNDAAKSSQTGKIHIADSGVATLQEFLQLAVSKELHIISPEEYRGLSRDLSEAGAMLGEWLKGRKNG